VPVHSSEPLVLLIGVEAQLFRFLPNCRYLHLKGVELTICLATNDAFVMEVRAWVQLDELLRVLCRQKSLVNCEPSQACSLRQFLC
jgi:hypothetical protein